MFISYDAMKTMQYVYIILLLLLYTAKETRVETIYCFTQNIYIWYI